MKLCTFTITMLDCVAQDVWLVARPLPAGPGYTAFTNASPVSGPLLLLRFSWMQHLPTETVAIQLKSDTFNSVKCRHLVSYPVLCQFVRCDPAPTFPRDVIPFGHNDDRYTYSLARGGDGWPPPIHVTLTQRIGHPPKFSPWHQNSDSPGMAFVLHRRTFTSKVDLFAEFSHCFASCVLTPCFLSPA
ncbi:hypothetical protein IQ07DRAFT_181950 [Pyrenochaeta sp. DS3sAY3a]|nr:hypothetical protein IQ07DRAFT_181950 [Pyrenochaeta sp. DS3sAY3a]